MIATTTTPAAELAAWVAQTDRIGIAVGTALDPDRDGGVWLAVGNAAGAGPAVWVEDLDAVAQEALGNLSLLWAAPGVAPVPAMARSVLVQAQVARPDLTGERDLWLGDLRPRLRFCAAGTPAQEARWRAVETARLLAEVDADLITADPEGAPFGSVGGLAMIAAISERAWRGVSKRGLRIDGPALRDLSRDLTARRKTARKRFGADLWQDTKPTRVWLHERGIEVLDVEGAPSLSNDFYDAATVPDSAREDWEAFRAVRADAALAKKVGELVEALDASPDGRLRPTIRELGARTGRQSISGPALQNLPARLRPLLLADEGKVLVGCDLDRVEPRVMAVLSGDEALSEAVRTDVYTETAVRIWGEEARGDAARRSAAKTTFLAIAYGKRVRRLAFDLGVSQAEAQGLLDGLHAAYPVMATWARDIERRTMKGEPLRTLLGRTLPVPDAAYKGVNYAVQGSAADLFCQMLMGVIALLGDEVLFLPVHDELVIQVPADRAQEGVEVLEDAMSAEMGGVEFTSTAVVLGERWGKTD